MTVATNDNRIDFIFENQLDEQMNKELHKFQFNYFERKIVLFYFGLLGDTNKEKKDIADYLNIQYSDFIYFKGRAFRKIIASKHRMEFVNFIKSRKGSKGILNETFDYPAEWVEEAVNSLKPEEIELCKLRDFEYYKLVTSEKEKMEYSRIRNKEILPYLKGKRKEESLKSAISYVDPDLSEKFQRIKDKITDVVTTPMFKELIKFFEVKEAFAIMMYWGLIDGIFYSANDISRTFRIPLYEVETLIKKENVFFNREFIRGQIQGLITEETEKQEKMENVFNGNALKLKQLNDRFKVNFKKNIDKASC